MDYRVRAIRDDARVGRGTCSIVDECYEDYELVIALDEENVKTQEAAVQWAIEFERAHAENALNARWGEDDDPELDRWNDITTQGERDDY